MSANASNARLDRIEKLIEQRKRANKEAQARHEQAQARHEREMADSRAEGRKPREDFRDDSKRFRDFLRRWAALGVREARDQRKRQRAIDLSLTRLAAAQLVTEKLLANFIASRAGRNGGGHRSRT